MHRKTRPILLHDAACPDFIAYLDLRQAIVHHEFFLEYQPKVSLGSGLVEGVEALVRWKHRKLGRIEPDMFIPRLERSQLIQNLTWSVLDEAVERCAAFHSQGFLLGVAVNVSPAAVTEALPVRVDAALKQHSLNPHWLTLEVTQSMPFENIGRAHAVLNAIRARGVHLSLDDFGTGYASVAQLQSLHFDEVKIDMMFVKPATHSERDAEIVKSITALGRALGMRVVAEGIEDPKTLSFMHSLGVDVAQGNYLAPALDPGDLIAELTGIATKVRSRLGPRALDLRAKDVESARQEDRLWA